MACDTKNRLSRQATDHNIMISLYKFWLGRKDSNLRMAESKSAALPLGYAPRCAGPYLRKHGRSIARHDFDAAVSLGAALFQALRLSSGRTIFRNLLAWSGAVVQ
jgi:hypothetical protein